MTLKRTTLRHRLCVATLGTSLGLFATTVNAQDSPRSDTGRAIGDAIGNQLQRGSTDPVQRGAGAAVRGAIQGQSAGDAARQGLGEAARSATETPRQTLQRDQFETGRAYQDGRIYQDGRFDQRNRVYQEGQVQGRAYQGQPYQGQPYQGQPGFRDGRVYQDERVYQQGNIQGGAAVQGQAAGRATQQRARLGITMNTQAAAASRGVVVKNVAEGTAAAQAGLRAGDVIVGINGQQVSSPQQVASLIHQRNVGDQVMLNVLRNGQEERIHATLTAAQSQAARGYQAGRAINSDDPEQLRQQIQMLQQEVQDLRRQLQQNRGEAPADARRTDATGADTQFDTERDAEAAQRLETDTATDRDSLDLNLDADADADAAADSAGRLDSDLEADNSLDADSSLDLDTGDDTDFDAEFDADFDADAGAQSGARAGAQGGAAGDL